MQNSYPDMRFSHLGIAVKNLEKAAEQYRFMGYADTDGEVYEDYLQKVKTRFLNKDGVIVELIEALNKDGDSPLTSYLKGSFHNIYHICYMVADLEDAIELLVKAKYRVMTRIIPGIGLGGRRICFMFHIYCGLIELVEEST
jgi:methylmalonyl-CoA epimerase